MSTVTIGPPTWLAALQMDAYLQESSDLTAWQQLVTSFYKFEKLNTINGVRISILCSLWISDNSMVQNLPTTMCPEEVASWIKKEELATQGQYQYLRVFVYGVVDRSSTCLEGC